MVRWLFDRFWIIGWWYIFLFFVFLGVRVLFLRVWLILFVVSLFLDVWFSFWLMVINDWVSVWCFWLSKFWVNEENKIIIIVSEMINDFNVVFRVYFNLREMKWFFCFCLFIVIIYLGVDNVIGFMNGLDVVFFIWLVNFVV